MAMRMYSSLKNKDVITNDAYIAGSVSDINYSSETWDIHSLYVRGAKGVEGVLRTSAFKKLQFSLVKGDYDINDVILIPETREQLPRALTYDDTNSEKLGSLIGKTVVSKDEIPIGSVEDVGIDFDAWKINSFKVKLDKSVANALDIKLGLLNRTVSGLLTNHVDTITKTMNLSYKVEDLRGYFTLD